MPTRPAFSAFASWADLQWQKTLWAAEKSAAALRLAARIFQFSFLTHYKSLCEQTNRHRSVRSLVPLRGSPICDRVAFGIIDMTYVELRMHLRSSMTLMRGILICR